jgi:hypothetical protein
MFDVAVTEWVLGEPPHSGQGSSEVRWLASAPHPEHVTPGVEVTGSRKVTLTQA